MSRAAATQCNSTTSLMVREIPNDMPVALLAKSESFGHKSADVEFGAMIMALGLLSYSQQVRSDLARKKYLDEEQRKRKKKFTLYNEFTSRIPGIFNLNYATLTYILDFLLARNTYQSIPLVLAPETIAVEKHGDRITHFARCLEDTAKSCLAIPSAPLNTDFFSKNYQAGFEFANLLDAALNADLEMVGKILSEASAINRQTFLSTRGKAVITHLGILRTGTPLQMALYSHDEQMVEVIKRYMNPQEFRRQCEEIFGTNYIAFLARQQAEATQLCSELENAFRQASRTDVTKALNHVANTTSALQDVLNRFEENLKRYVRENRVHNPYISQCLLEIYYSLRCTWNIWNKECLFSQQPFGLAEKLSSACWLQHFAQGIFYLSDESPAGADRSFLSKNSNPLDVRTLDRLGVDCCINIFGRRGHAAARRGVNFISLVEAGIVVTKVISNKNSKLSELITPRVQPTHCCIIQ